MPSIETHPWEPFIPQHAKVLIMGTFPPQPKRWSMDFYYPNATNDFWPMMGLIFLGDRKALFDSSGKHYDLNKIKELLEQKGIALNDTGREIIRHKNNASDKFLEIVTPVPLDDLLRQMPECRTIVTTGMKAAEVVAMLTATAVPAMGESVVGDGGMSIWRMPSTSRAYPMALEKKAEYYRHMFVESQVLSPQCLEGESLFK